MSRTGVPLLDEFPATQYDDELDLNVPELFVQPPTPKLRTTNAIEIPWSTTRHRLSVDHIYTRMHPSSSEPSTMYSGDFGNPLTRDRRSQSVPLSLDAVTLSKKLVNVSDMFEAKQQAIRRRGRGHSRTLSSSESPRNATSNRHSDLIEEWKRERDVLSPKIGSPV